MKIESIDKLIKSLQKELIFPIFFAQRTTKSISSKANTKSASIPKVLMLQPSGK